MNRHRSEIQNKSLFADCTMDGHEGLPNWSSYIWKTISEKSEAGNDVVWMASDYKFNNADFDTIISKRAGDDLFLDTMGKSRNIDPTMMTDKHITGLGMHSLRIIDRVVQSFPKVRLILWCLYMRSRVRSSSYNPYLWYDALCHRYASNMIDIDKYTDPVEFSTFVTDDGGHPNGLGYELLSNMIAVEFGMNNVTTAMTSRFVGRVLQFGREDGSLISNISLAPDGHIAGSSNENERMWRKDGKSITFLDANGRATTCFDQYKVFAGRPAILGNYLMRPDRPRHVIYAADLPQ